MILTLILCCLQDDVETLIEQLRSDGIEARSEAVGKLIEMGEPACGKLLPHMNDRDPEVRGRVREVLVKIAAPGPLIDFMLGSDASLASAAADAFHHLHRSCPWDRLALNTLRRLPRRTLTFEELRVDLTNSGVPVLRWPANLAVEATDLTGTYEEMLQALPVAYTVSEGAVILHAKGDDLRARPFCRVMTETMSRGDGSPAIFFADLCTGPIEEALVSRVDGDGFWKHATDILIYRCVKRGNPKLSDRAKAAMAGRLKDPVWTGRAIAAQALIASRHLPGGALRSEDPVVRYLAACISEEAKIHHSDLYRVMRDRHRDLRTRALFAAFASGTPQQMDFDAMLHATCTIADVEPAIDNFRKMRDVEPLGLAAAKLLKTEHKRIAFRILDVFTQEKVLLEICTAAEGETEEWAQERYLFLLERAYEEKATTAPAQRALLGYLAVKSERIGWGAAEILIEQKRNELRDGIGALLDHEILAVRTRAGEALYTWAYRHYRLNDSENDEVAKLFERRAGIEKDAQLAEILRAYASRLRGRAAKGEPRDWGGSYSGSRLGGKRNLISRGGGGSDSWGGWIPWVDVTIPRPDLQDD